MKRLISILSIIFLLTSATIIFEISLSRLFSYMLNYHFVLIIIAFSILGLGIGQIWYSRHSERFGKSINNWFAFVPASLLFSYLALLIIPRFEIFSTANGGLIAFIILSTIPFIFIGLIYAHLFQENNNQLSLLYGFDLLGAATGALLSVLLLNSLNLGVVFGIAASILLLAFVLFVLMHRQHYSKLGIAVFGGFLLILLVGGNKVIFEVPIADDPSKDMLRLMKSPGVESEIIDSRWSAFGKTDLVKFTYPDSTESEVLFIDGAAGTSVVNIDELMRDSVKLIRELGGFPALFSMDFLLEDEKDTALVIGPGGGVDIAAAWLAGFKYIEAVEVNPSFVELMEKYNRPTFGGKDNIEVHLNEGRNFVREGKSKYDAILLTIPVTKGGRGADFYSLTENYLFTVEALSDYLESLTQEGAIFFTMHGRNEVYKMLANYLELENRQGVGAKEAFKRVYIISNRMNPVMVIRKNAFEPERIQEIHYAAHQVRLDEDVFFFPYIEQVNFDNTTQKNINFAWYMFDNLLYDISTGKYPYSKIWEASMLNLSPAFDNTPFFFNYNLGIPDALSIPVWLGIAIIVWFLFKLITGWGMKPESSEGNVLMRNRFGFLTLMVLLVGFSYFFVQAYLFQILNLRLSNPTQSFSLLLFAFLLGNGLGSLLTRFFNKSLPRTLMIATAAIIIASLVTVFVLFPISKEHLSEMGIALLLLLPSFFIGMPFPLLLKMGTEYQGRNVIPLLLGVSSVAGVAASVFAIVVSISSGYKMVFLFGLLGYGVLILMAFGYQKIENKVGLNLNKKL